LNNLGLEYIDLLVIHKNDANCPLEEVMRAMTYLVDSGQIMYWATSRYGQNNAILFGFLYIDLLSLGRMLFCSVPSINSLIIQINNNTVR